MKRLLGAAIISGFLVGLVFIVPRAQGASLPDLQSIQSQIKILQDIVNALQGQIAALQAQLAGGPAPVPLPPLPGSGTANPGTGTTNPGGSTTECSGNAKATGGGSNTTNNLSGAPSGNVIVTAKPWLDYFWPGQTPPAGFESYRCTVKITWAFPAPGASFTAHQGGYRIYRSTDGNNWQKIGEMGSAAGSVTDDIARGEIDNPTAMGFNENPPCGSYYYAVAGVYGVNQYGQYESDRAKTLTPVVVSGCGSTSTNPSTPPPTLTTPPATVSTTVLAGEQFSLRSGQITRVNTSATVHWYNTVTAGTVPATCNDCTIPVTVQEWINTQQGFKNYGSARQFNLKIGQQQEVGSNYLYALTVTGVQNGLATFSSTAQAPATGNPATQENIVITSPKTYTDGNCSSVYCQDRWLVGTTRTISWVARPTISRRLEIGLQNTQGIYTKLFGDVDPKQGSINFVVPDLPTGGYTVVVNIGPMGSSPEPGGTNYQKGFFLTHIPPIHDFSSSEAFITHLYRTILKREPDPNGLSGWRAQFKSGVSLKDIYAGFVNSAEFKTKRGSISNIDYVKLMYEAVMFQEPADDYTCGGVIYHECYLMYLNGASDIAKERLNVLGKFLVDMDFQANVLPVLNGLRSK